MDLGIKSKVALVNGAGGGLGGAIATALAREGARVIAADVHEESVRKTVADIRAAGGAAEAVVWDLGDIEGLSKAFPTVKETYGPIEILVNNSGGPPPLPLADVKHDMWEKQFQAMVLGILHLTNLALPDMRAKGWGRIITSTSSGVVAPIPNLGISNALRSTLVGWSKTLAREVARQGITANVILPGRIATKRITSLDEAKAARESRTAEDVMKESTESIPLGRYGRPDEYADAVAFLASERASYITGSIIRVDGGLIASI